MDPKTWPAGRSCHNHSRDARWLSSSFCSLSVCKWREPRPCATGWNARLWHAQIQMTESAKLLDPGFSTADAEYPDFALRDSRLRVRFSDWRKQLVVVEFYDVAGVRWQEHEAIGPEERNDSVYEILNSHWLKDLLSARAREPAEGHRHFKLGFNAYGPLEVLATAMQIVADDAP